MSAEPLKSDQPKPRMSDVKPCEKCERMHILQAPMRGYVFKLSDTGPHQMELDGWREIGDAADDGMYWRPCEECRSR